MRRFLALLLAGGLGLTLLGCAQSAQSVSGTTSTSASKTTISADTITDETASDEGTEEGNKDTPSAAGQVRETTYTQPHFHFQITLKDPWVFASSDALAAQNQDMIHTAADEAVVDAVADGNLFVDMAANNPETFNALAVRIVKLSLADYFLDEDTLYGTYLGMVREDASASGLTDLENQTGRITFLGEETRYVGVKGKLTLSDELTTEMYNYCLVRKAGRFACLIYISGIPTFGSESFEEMVGHFAEA